MSDAARLAIMCGLPKSGKTTYAGGLQEAGWVRAYPDDVRYALHGRGPHPPAEPLVWANAELTVRALLLGGHSVVVDATNTTGRRRTPWLGIARDHEAPIEAFRARTPRWVPRAQPRLSRSRTRGGHRPHERAMPPSRRSRPRYTPSSARTAWRWPWTTAAQW